MIKPWPLFKIKQTTGGEYTQRISPKVKNIDWY